MTNIKSLDDLVAKHAAEFADQIRAAAMADEVGSGQTIASGI